MISGRPLLCRCVDMNAGKESQTDSKNGRMIDFQLLGLAFILLHEMDAIKCKEWRIFPGLSMLNNQLGFIVFVFIYIPLCYFFYSKSN